MLPTVDLAAETLRIYFASLDETRVGRVGYVDLDYNDPTRVIAESEEPVFDVGAMGTFDESGVTPCSVVNVNGKKYLYYMGWQRCEQVPYMIFTGLAVSEDGVNFARRPVPVIDRNTAEPFLRSAPTVLYLDGGFKAWYVSGLGWTRFNNAPCPTYVIRYAESDDGIEWKSRLEPCISFRNENEFGLGRPWVIYDDGFYKMWYSIRSQVDPYSIGYAESGDGLVWTRMDDRVGIARSGQGWDSEMICYAAVADVGQHRYMFYNGNRHGITGFGCAVLEP